MDQLHGTHDNGRAAKAPAQTRDLTEQQAAQSNDVKNTTRANGRQGVGGTQGSAVFEVTAGNRNSQSRGRCCHGEREGDNEGDGLRTPRQRRR
jgi:hypothetical protein